MPFPSLTKPGTLREGFQYQDLYGMHLALSWLEHPANYVWLRFEAEEFGSLDDVAILKSDHTLSLVQVKHVTERPDRPGLSLDDLLEKKGKRSRSLFEKWFQSWLNVVDDPQYKSIEAVIYTNRPPAEDLVAVLDSGTPQKIPGGFVLHDVLVSGAGYPLILRAQPAEVFRRSATAGEVNPQQQQQRLFEMNSHNGSLLKEFPFRQTTPGRGEVRLCLQAYRHLLRHDR